MKKFFYHLPLLIRSMDQLDTDFSTIKGLSFGGWKTALDPDNLSVLSILNFRRMKEDFSGDKKTEYRVMSTFLSCIANSTGDERWRKAAAELSNKI